MAQLNTNPSLSEWIDYIEKMEQIEKRKSVPMSASQTPVVSAIYKPVNRSERVIYTSQQHRNQHHNNKDKDIVSHDNNADKVANFSTF